MAGHILRAGRPREPPLTAAKNLMPKVLMYSTAICPYCVMAERLLKSRGVEAIEKLRVDLEPTLWQEMSARTGRRTVPQIFIDDQHVGGFDDLARLDRSGGLQTLLAAQPPVGPDP